MSFHKHEPLYFEDIEVGDCWESPARTITEADIVLFAGLTGDYNPLHVNEEYAKQTPFRGRIAHGLLGLALVAGLGSTAPLMRTTAFVRILEWEFRQPLRIGDTVHVVTEVLAKEAYGRRRGLITWRRRLINQRGEVIQEGKTQTMVEMRSAQRAN